MALPKDATPEQRKYARDYMRVYMRERNKKIRELKETQKKQNVLVKVDDERINAKTKEEIEKFYPKSPLTFEEKIVKSLVRQKQK